MATSERDKDFYQGVAVVLGWMARGGYDSHVKYCMDDNGITLEQLQAAKVDNFDLRAIKRSLK